MIKKFFFNIIVLCMTLCVLHGEDNSEKINLNDSLSISELIAINFLKAKKKYSEDRKHYGENRTEEENIFDCMPVHLHGVDIRITPEGFGDSAIVILESTVKGALEEFEEKSILENEKKLLKFILLEIYFEKIKKIQAEGCDIPTIIPIDKFTKVTCHPVPILTNEIFYSVKAVVECKNPREMKFTTFFLASEFDDFIKKYYSK